MNPRPATPRDPAHAIRLWAVALAAALAFGVGGASPASAAVTVKGATVSASRGSAPKRHAPGACRCGMDCGERCCCAPKSTPASTPPAPARPELPAGTPVSPGPCLGAAPCGGGAAVPSARPILSHAFEPAALGASAASLPDPAGDRLTPVAVGHTPERPASPPDRPPEPGPF